MSLDVYAKNKTKIYEYDAINSSYRCWSVEEKHRMLTNKTNEVFYWNITHNLVEMAEHIPTQICIEDKIINTNMYVILWHPDTLFKAGTKITMHDLTKSLEFGFNYMVANEKKLSKYNPKNYWGHYSNLLNFIVNYIRASYNWPNAIITTSA